MNATTDSAPLTKAMFDAVLAEVYTSKPKNPDLIVISKDTNELFSLMLSLEGRNWRRIKRETRKLFKRQLREMRLNPPKPNMGRATSLFWQWRNQSLTETPINAII